MRSFKKAVVLGSAFVGASLGIACSQQVAPTEPHVDGPSVASTGGPRAAGDEGTPSGDVATSGGFDVTGFDAKRFAGERWTSRESASEVVEFRNDGPRSVVVTLDKRPGHQGAKVVIDGVTIAQHDRAHLEVLLGLSQSLNANLGTGAITTRATLAECTAAYASLTALNTAIGVAAAALAIAIAAYVPFETAIAYAAAALAEVKAAWAAAKAAGFLAQAAALLAVIKAKEIILKQAQDAYAAAKPTLDAALALAQAGAKAAADAYNAKVKWIADNCYTIFGATGDGGGGFPVVVVTCPSPLVASSSGCSVPGPTGASGPSCPSGTIADGLGGCIPDGAGASGASGPSGPSGPSCQPNEVSDGMGGCIPVMTPDAGASGPSTPAPTTFPTFDGGASGPYMPTFP